MFNEHCDVTLIIILGCWVLMDMVGYPLQSNQTPEEFAKIVSVGITDDSLVHSFCP
jgi:hypothetical protein